jgi:hypothetical protein
MSKDKKTIINVQGTAITILSQREEDYISLTDMVKHFDGGSALIEQWLKNKDTVLFLGVWEQIHNPEFNSLEFEGIRNEAGRNSFFLSAKKWVELTNARGLSARAGRYGGHTLTKTLPSNLVLGLVRSLNFILSKNSNVLKTMKTADYRWSGILAEPCLDSTIGFTPMLSKRT